MNSLSIQNFVLHARSADELTERITSSHGLFVQIADAWQVMGFKTYGAARRAAADDRLGLPTALLPGRRSRVIRSKDLARWLFEQYQDACVQSKIYKTKETAQQE